MNTETSLTNFTDSKIKVDKLLEQKKITLKDIQDFNQPEHKYLRKRVNRTLSRLTGEERDNFLDKTSLILTPDSKSEIWEYNHSMITDAIAHYMREYGIMPAQSDIAKETGLSRQTIGKHFKEYKTQPEFIDQMEQFKFMAPKMLASVFKAAGSGDMRAARLYFEMVGAINKPQANTVINGQNNYIQINNTILSQENLKQLSAEQLNRMESIITNG